MFIKVNNSKILTYTAPSVENSLPASFCHEKAAWHETCLNKIKYTARFARGAEDAKINIVCSQFVYRRRDGFHLSASFRQMKNENSLGVLRVSAVKKIKNKKNNYKMPLPEGRQ